MGGRAGREGLVGGGDGSGAQTLSVVFLEFGDLFFRIV